MTSLFGSFDGVGRLFLIFFPTPRRIQQLSSPTHAMINVFCAGLQSSGYYSLEVVTVIDGVVALREG